MRPITIGALFRIGDHGKHSIVRFITFAHFISFSCVRRLEESRDDKGGTGGERRYRVNRSPTVTSIATASCAMNGCPPDRTDSSEIEVAVVRASKEMQVNRTSGTDTAHSWTVSDSTLQTLSMSVDTIGGGISNATTCQINSNTTTINDIDINGDGAKMHRTTGEVSSKLAIRNVATKSVSENQQQRVNVIAITAPKECKPIVETTKIDNIGRCDEQQRRQECHSSSDENRSSGHASMSDTGNGSSSPGCGNNNRDNGIMLDTLDEDRLAVNLPIEQMHEHSAGTSSTYSSLTAESEGSVPAQNIDRYLSLETVNTNETTADSIVWIDNHNRLVELAHTPWNQHSIQRAIEAGRCRERVSPEIIPRLGYLLQVIDPRPLTSRGNEFFIVSFHISAPTRSNRTRNSAIVCRFGFGLQA